MYDKTGTMAQNLPIKEKGRKELDVKSNTKCTDNNVNLPASASVFKRKNETTLDDVVRLMEENVEKQTKHFDDKLDTLSKKIEAFTSKVDMDINALTNRIDNMESKIDDNKYDNREFCVNYMKQERQDCCMDIVGFRDEIIQSYQDLKQLACEIIKSFKIQLDESCVTKASLKEIRDRNTNEVKKRVLVVTFADKEEKWRVMKAKKEIKSNNGIYFNPTMTSFNRYLWGEARRITKPQNGNVYFRDGNVKVKINDEPEIIIANVKDLEEMETKLNASVSGNDVTVRNVGYQNTQH